MREVEIITHDQIEGITMFFDTVDYRSPHLHPEWEIMLVLENDMMVRSLQYSRRVVPGEMVVFNPSQPHEFEKSTESSTALFAQISPYLFETVFPEISSFSLSAHSLPEYCSREEYEQKKRELALMMRTYLNMEKGYQLGCLAMAAGLLSFLFQVMPVQTLSYGEIIARDKRNERLLRFLKYVDENYMHKIRLADFAGKEGISLSYCSVFIREELNQTFQEYVSTVRFEAACRLMRSAGLNMQEICYAAGFSDYRYFADICLKRTGMTPEQYRKAGMIPDEGSTRHHGQESREQFYTRTQSLEMLEKYFPELS